MDHEELFKDIKYYVINCNDKEVLQLLRSHGASEQTFPSERMTFAVSDDPNLPEVGEAQDLYAVPVITSEWIRMSIEATRRLPFGPFHPSSRQLFNGVVAVLAEISIEDRKILWAHISLRGGRMQHKLDKMTTHLIVGRPGGTLYNFVRENPSSEIAMVTPDWVLDSVSEMFSLPVEDYHPDLLRPPTPPPPPPPQPVHTTPQPTAPVMTGRQTQHQQQMVSGGTTAVSQAAPGGPPQNLHTSIAQQQQQVVVQQGARQEVLPQLILHQQRQQKMQFFTIPGQQQKQQTVFSQVESGGQSGETPHLLASLQAAGGQQAGSKVSPAPQVGPPSGMVTTARFLAVGGPGTGNQQQQHQHQQRFMGGGGVRTAHTPRMQHQPRQQHPRFHMPGQAVLGHQQHQQVVGPPQVMTSTTAPTGLLNPPSNQMMTSAQGQSVTYQMGQQQQQQQQAAMPTNTAASVVSAAGINVPTTTGSSSSSGGSVGSKSKSKSSKHVQEQALNEEEKDAIVMQNVKSILMQQHNWNREQHGKQSSNTLNVTATGVGGLGAASKKPKSPKSPSRTKSPKSPKAAKGKMGQQQAVHQVAAQAAVAAAAAALPGMNQSSLQISGTQAAVGTTGASHTVTPIQGLPRVTLQQHQQQMKGKKAVMGQAPPPAMAPPPPPAAPQQIQQVQTTAQAVQSTYNTITTGGPGLIKQVSTTPHPQQQQQQQQHQQQQTTQHVIPGGPGQPQSIQHQTQQQIPLPMQQQPQQTQHIMSHHLAQVGNVNSQTQIQQDTKPIGNVFVTQGGSVIPTGPQQPSHQTQQQIIHQQQPTPQTQQQQVWAQQQQHVVSHNFSNQSTPIGQPYPTNPNMHPLQRPQMMVGGHAAGPPSMAQTQQALAAQQQHQQGHVVLQSPGTPTGMHHAGMAHPSPQQGGPMVRMPGGRGTSAMIQQHAQSSIPLVQQQEVARGVHPGGPVVSPSGPHVLQSPGMVHLPSGPAAPTPTGSQFTPGAITFQGDPTAAALRYPVYLGQESDRMPAGPEEVLAGCVFYICGYVDVSAEEKAQWRRVMRRAGAEISDKYDRERVNIVLVDSQIEDPDLFKTVLRDKKRVTTIFWINDVLHKCRLDPPFEILHLPSPFSKRITFSHIRSLVIGITGFIGVERMKVEQMIRQIGAKFTDYLDTSNTLLVCKKPEGKKYERAQRWGIHCVNVRWLQAIYLGDLNCLDADVDHRYLSFEEADVSLQLDRFTHYVQDLMVGWLTSIKLTSETWAKHAAHKVEFMKEENERKRKAEEALASEPEEKKAKCPLTPLTEEEIELALSCKLRDTTKPTYTRVSTSNGLPERPVSTREECVDQEGKMDMETSQGAANGTTQSEECALKQEAMEWSAAEQEGVAETQEKHADPTESEGVPVKPLTDEMSGDTTTSIDTAVTGGGQSDGPSTEVATEETQSKIVEPPPSSTPESTSTDAVSTHTTAAPPAPVTFAMKPTSSSSPKLSADPFLLGGPPIVAFTGVLYDQRDMLTYMVEELGGRVVENAVECSHLVAPKIIRTPKFYHAIHKGRYIMSPKWIQASALRKTWLDESTWQLEDPVTESQFGFSLRDSLRRARERILSNGLNLFEGLEFWLSPGAKHRDVCIELIRVGGGQIRDRRPTQKMALMPLPRQLVICHEEDRHLANYLMRTKTGNKAVHHEEFVLSGVMRQEVDYETYQIQYVTPATLELCATVATAHAHNLPMVSEQSSPSRSVSTSSATTPTMDRKTPPIVTTQPCIKTSAVTPPRGPSEEQSNGVLSGGLGEGPREALGGPSPMETAPSRQLETVASTLPSVTPASSTAMINPESCPASSSLPHEACQTGKNGPTPDTIHSLPSTN